MAHKELPIEFVRECFSHDPGKPNLIWKKRPVHHFSTERGMKIFNGRFAGKIAGSKTPEGYIEVGLTFEGVFSVTLAHRLIFLHYFGAFPKGDIEHINGNRADNRLANLKDIPRKDSMKKRKVGKNNRSGRIGISWHKHSERWYACIGKNGRTEFLGYFDDFGDAVAARVAAEKRLKYHKTHGRAA